MNYTQNIPNYGNLMTRDEYISMVKCGAFIDYDGYGNPVLNNKCNSTFQVWPSELEKLPVDCTHIIWFNK